MKTNAVRNSCRCACTRPRRESMDKHQARFILQSCRPEGRDADDPLFTEAWRAVEGDSELGGGLARGRALDLSIAASLKNAPIPAALPARLLSGIQARSAERRHRRAK